MTLLPDRPRSRRICVWLVAVALLSAAAAGLFFYIGRWLVVEDPLERADAIVVLSGGLPPRAIEAAAIYRQGFAPEVWLTRPAGPGEELQALGISYNGEEFYSREVLVAEGVPATAIRILDGSLVNTEEEVQAIAAELRRERKQSAILVTSPPHTRRARALWKKIAGENLRVIVRPAAEDPFDARHWWRTTRDALSVVRETLGLFNVWFGLPVRPASGS